MAENKLVLCTVPLVEDSKPTCKEYDGGYQFVDMYRPAATTELSPVHVYTVRKQHESQPNGSGKIRSSYLAVHLQLTTGEVVKELELEAEEYDASSVGTEKEADKKAVRRLNVSDVMHNHLTDVIMLCSTGK